MTSRTSSCSSCGADMVWVTTAAGKPMPIDPEPVENGNIELRDDVAHYVKPEQSALFAAPRYVSHFATCPHAAQHRKSK